MLHEMLYGQCGESWTHAPQGRLTKSQHSSVGYVSVTIPPAKYDNLSDPMANNEGSGTVTISWLEVETFDLHAHGST